MKEQLVNFETAKLAKEKGFNEKCDSFFFPKREVVKSNNFFNNNDLSKNKSGTAVSAPTQSLLQKWLRDIHGIEIAVQWFDNCYIKAVNKRPFKANTYRIEGFSSYEEIFEIGLQEGLKII